jgi:hypothetical protein
MNSYEFYTHRISNFVNERKIFTDYEKILTSHCSAMDSHSLVWDKENHSLVEMKKSELKSLDDELERLEVERSDLQELIRNYQESKNERREQLDKLSTLTQPVQYDTTYLIPDRFPQKTLVGQKPKQLPVNPLHSIKQLKSGDIMILESRLSDETRKIESHVKTFDNKTINYLNLITERKAMLEEGVKPLTVGVEKLIDELEYLDRQCYVSVVELLGLRLKIMISQREEVDELDRLSQDKDFITAREAETREQLISEMQLMRKRLDEELLSCTTGLMDQKEKLEREIKKLESILERSSSVETKASVQIQELQKAILRAKER